MNYRIAVNVKSQEYPSELLYRVDEDFRHPVTAQLSGLAPGWHRLDAGPAGVNLDYVRQTLFDRTLLRPLPADVAGPGNDLADLLDDQVQRAIREPAAIVYAFGERWGPDDGVPDKIFGFEPGNGVHDIHMNQGNVGTFRKDDGVWQDGAVIIALPDQQRWVGIFLAFQSQSWHTDDKTGHTLVDGPIEEFGAEAVRIVAALINPVGPAPEAETVTAAERVTRSGRPQRLASGRSRAARRPDPGRCPRSRRDAPRAPAVDRPAGQQGRRDHPARQRRSQGPRRRLHREPGRGFRLDGRLLTPVSAAGPGGRRAR